MGFPCGSPGKESACNVGDLGLIPGLGRSPGEGKGYPLSILAWRIPLIIKKRIKYSGLEKAFYKLKKKKEQIKKESTFFKVFNPHFPKVLTYSLEHKHCSIFYHFFAAPQVCPHREFL